MNLGLMLLLPASLANAAADIKTAPSDKYYQTKTVTSDVEIPWGMAQLPSGDILVSERKGKLRLIRNGKLVEQSISGLPKIHSKGQGGLLDLELHPNFANNNWLYITYSSPEGKGAGSNTALIRAKLNVEQMRLEQVETLYKGEDNTTKGQHFGSRIAFDGKGYVFFSIGDRGARDVKPQNLSLDGGKIYRLHEDGRIPNDNPFVNASDFPKAKTATFSYGHRNPQGLALNPATGEMWSQEHGPRGGDEVNLIQAGKNYGWPVISYGINYNGTKFTDLTAKAGMEQPLHYWDPSIAPSDMVFVTSDKYPQWQGKLLIGSLKFNYVVLLDIDKQSVTGQSKLFDGIGRVRSLLQGQDGYLYVGTDGDGVKRIEPKNN